MASPGLKVGQNVKSTGKEAYQGILRYIGPVQGAPGIYCGIELPDSNGKNDGEAKGKRYFHCAPNHGVFVKKEAVVVISTTKPAAKRMSTAPQTTATSRPVPLSTTSKRTSIAPAPRQPTARQSISSVAPVRKPTTSRPSSFISRDSAPSKHGRQSSVQSRVSVQSTPRVLSPEKRIPEESLEDEQDGEDDEQEEEAHEDDEVEESEEEAPRPPIPAPAPAPVPAHTEPVAVAAVRRTSIRASSAELQAAQRENEQLKVKLRAMEKKRIEDRDALKQIDTMKSENDRLSNIIKTMSDKVKKATEERQAAQARALELEKMKQDEPERPAQLDSELELATIDKEMAEEKVDALEHELGLLQAKFDELQEETERIREENKELGTSMTEEQKSSAGWIHLERERDRLRNALLQLKDVKEEVEADYKQEIEQLRGDLDEAEDMAAKYIETEEQLQRMQDINQQLKEQLEAAENQEDVISSMMDERDRHLNQIEELRALLSEREELVQINEDLEQLYRDNEKGLLSRLDEQEVMLTEQDRKTAERDHTIEDLEYTLNKFRSVMQGLQSDIDDARRTREISEMQAQEMSSRSKAMMDLNMRLQNNASKSQTKAIELEMTKSQALLAKTHADILGMFLPETFDSDRNPILAMLSFSRLKTKAGLVASMLTDRLRDRDHLSSGDEIISGYKIVQSMRAIYLTADRFERFMATCSPTEFAAFSNSSQDIEPVERAVTNWLESLKSDELGPDSHDHMKRMESILADLLDKLLPINAESKASQLITETQMASTNVDIAASLLEWISRTVKQKLGDPSDDDEDSVDFDRKIDQLGRVARTMKVMCGKLMTELEKKRRAYSCMNETAWPLFTNVEGRAATVHEYTQQLCQIVLNYLNDIEPDEELSYSGLLASLDENNDDVLSTLMRNLKTLHDEIESLLSKANEVTPGLAFESQPAPWIIRAKEIRNQRITSNEVQEELAQSARRNHELTSRIAEKERAIEDITIRAQLAEKRVRDNKSREGQDKVLREEIEELKSEKSELEAQLSEARSELARLQDESSKDKDELITLQRQATERALNGAAVAPNTRQIDPATSDAMSAHVSALLAEVAGLEATVRHLRWENRELSIPISKTKFKAATQAWLDPSHLRPPKSRQRTKAMLAQQQQKNALDTLLDISNSMNMRPVRLRDTWHKDDKWRPARETTRWQVLRQKEELEAWNGLRDTAAEGFVVRVR